MGPWQFTHVTTRTYHDRDKLERAFRLAWPGHVPHLPAIDFDREEVALATVGPRSGAGYSLRVLQATEERGRIVVILRERTPTLGKPGRVGLTYPYRLIVFHSTDKRTLVRVQGRP